MVGDVRLVTEIDIADGEIPIFDMNNMTLSHLSKVNLSVMRKYMLYTQVIIIIIISNEIDNLQ